MAEVHKIHDVVRKITMQAGVRDYVIKFMWTKLVTAAMFAVA